MERVDEKMKKIFKVLFKIGLFAVVYLLLCGLNNSRNIMINGYSYLFTKDVLLSVTMIISAIVLLIFIMFYGKLKSYKKIIFSSMIVIFSCAIFNGIFRDKQISRYIIIYLCIVLNSMFFSKVSNQKFEISVFFSCALLILTAIPFAMLNVLKIYKYLLIICEILVLLWLLIGILRKNKILENNIKTNINTKTIVIFSLMFSLFILGGVNRYVSSWDEYSHWGFDAKAVIENEKLTTCEEVVSSTRSYPPVLSIWHYINSIVLDFNEQNLYMWQSIYILICLMPAFTFFNKKNKFLLPLFVIVLFFGGNLFGSIYGYSSLYADFPIAATFFTSFVFYLKYRNNENESKKMQRHLLVSLSLLILIKPTGIIPAFTFFVIIIVDEFIKLGGYKFSFDNFWKKFYLAVKKYFKLGVIIVLIFVIWFGYVKICDEIVPKFYDKELIPDTLATGLEYKLNFSMIGKIYNSFISAMDSTVFMKFTLYQYIILMICLSFIVVKVKNNESYKNTFYKILPYLIGGAAFYFATFLSIFVTFTAYEASMLASFTRYLSTFNIAMFFLLMLYVCRNNFIVNEKKVTFSTIILIIMIFNISFNNITFFLSDYSKRIETRGISYDHQEKLKVVNENTPEDSQIYVLDQQDKDGIMAMWYTRYYCFPRKINAYQTSINWKIRTENNVDDLGDWGLTAQQLEDDLYNYNFDYLYLYTSDDQMYEQMKYMFEDYEMAKECSLFKIEKLNNGNVLLKCVE